MKKCLILQGMQILCSEKYYTMTNSGVQWTKRRQRHTKIVLLKNSASVVMRESEPKSCTDDGGGLQLST